MFKLNKNDKRKLKAGLPLNTGALPPPSPSTGVQHGYTPSTVRHFDKNTLQNLGPISFGPLGPRAQRKLLPPREGQFGFGLPNLPRTAREWQAPVEDGDNPENPFLEESHPDDTLQASPTADPSPIPFNRLFDITSSPASGGGSNYRAKKVKQHARWVNEIIPDLLYPYMELRRATANLRDPAPTYTTFNCGCGPACSHCSCRRGSLEEITVYYTECNGVAEQLIRCGLFPCAPLRPSFAVDLNILDFARLFYHQTAPNDTAWCQATEAFLSDRGYKLQFTDNLRRRFANTMLWYSYLRQQVQLEVDKSVNLAHHAVNPSWEVSPTPACGFTARKASSRTSDCAGEEESTPRAQRSQVCSAYLQRRCPACFGGKDKVTSSPDLPMPDVLVCVDACYTQKHNRMAYRDESLPNSDTIVVDESIIDAMESHINGVRPRAPRPSKRSRGADDGAESDDRIEAGLKVANSTLELCEKSFKAANGAVIKGTTDKHDVVSIMALVCRHDVALFVTNMRTAGEQQFYSLALIECLMQHLPRSWTVGILYDVACTLHSSCVKWGFLKRYLDRLSWGVSVFHAYGHQYACQSIYHPRKCIGFGLTDGEGCERFWHSLSRLIAYLRVCGYHRRNFTIDSQIATLTEEHLLRLGDWQQRKFKNCALLRAEAEKDLLASGWSVPDLQKQWDDQVRTSTAPLARQSKTQGKKAVEEALRLHDKLDILMDRLTRLEDLSIDDDVTSAVRSEARVHREQVKSELDQTRRALQGKLNELGQEDTEHLHALRSDKFTNARMNGLALLQRIHDKVVHRKHEMHRIARAVGKQKSGKQRLADHTLAAIEGRDASIKSLIARYNQKVGEQEDLIQKRAAPPKAAALPRLPRTGVFDLDVDSEIWFPLRARIEDDSGSPPAWLAKEDVRKGIQGMLNRQRCMEEETRLKHETRNLRTWFAEEWRAVHKLAETLNSFTVLHEVEQRKLRLLRLYARWDGKLADVPEESLSPWGPSEETLHQARQEWSSIRVAQTPSSSMYPDDDELIPLVDDQVDAYEPYAEVYGMLYDNSVELLS
ncbi:hypothetical protein GGG16DRAFT_61347 [Schizophyllum commune]